MHYAKPFPIKTSVPYHSHPPSTQPDFMEPYNLLTTSSSLYTLPVTHASLTRHKNTSSHFLPFHSTTLLSSVPLVPLYVSVSFSTHIHLHHPHQLVQTMYTNINIVPLRLALFSTYSHQYCSASLFNIATMRVAASAFNRRHCRKEKVIVIMGATGSGKTRLSVDLATSEIINSDKMQVYKGLDITTNKIPVHERRGVPHHLLGEFDPTAGEFAPSEFRRLAGELVAGISSEEKLPIIVGGSNSFIHSLLVERFEPESNLFDELSPATRPELTRLRYDCCFLWVDVFFPVLSEYLRKRVDNMLDSGMVDELAEFFNPDSGDLEYDSASRRGLRKAIGISEFDRYFKEYPPHLGLRGCRVEEGGDPVRKGAYDGAVRAIKDNTCQLAKRQIGKILMLKRAGWDLRRMDATASFRAALGDGGNWSEIWEREVLEPSVNIVKQFLKE